MNKITESCHYFTFYDYECNSFVLFNNFEFKHHSAFISMELFFLCILHSFLFPFITYILTSLGQFLKVRMVF